jgi:hypothetical protein
MLSFILPSSLSRRGEKREAKKHKQKEKEDEPNNSGGERKYETHWNDIRDRRKETKRVA